jgi:hypothetical protein
MKGREVSRSPESKARRTWRIEHGDAREVMRELNPDYCEMARRGRMGVYVAYKVKA